MTIPLSPIADSRRTLSAQVAERIRQAILNRTLAPGSRINQNRLADELQVSLIPVREALKTLEAEGLVTINARRGAFVTKISLDDLDELYRARSLIEGEAIALASQHLTDDDFVTLRQIIDAMRAATDAAEIHTFMLHNREFHMHIYNATGNRYLQQIIESLWERSELYRYRFMFVLRNADVIHKEHEDIFAACRAQDAECARTLAQNHIWHTRNGIYEQLADEFSAEANSTNDMHGD